jgi:ATP-dependent DNA helicase RecQ
LLDDDEAARSLLAERLAARPEEQRAARERFEAFRRCVRGANEDCLLSELFQQVEAGEPLVDPCGRCPACRAARTQPPKVFEYRGLRSFWPSAAEKARRCYLVGADADVEMDELLLRRLVPRIEQFVVPHGEGGVTAASLAPFAGTPGLVLEINSLVQGTAGLASLPTAVYLRETDDEDLNSAVIRLLRSPEIFGRLGLIIVVSRLSNRIDGRPIGQVVSSHAPVADDQLETLLDGYRQ